MTRPRFRDPRDRWPMIGESLPSGALPGPYEQARAILKMYVPSLPEDRRLTIASALAFEVIVTGWTVATFAAVLQVHAPDLFDVAPGEGLLQLAEEAIDACDDAKVRGAFSSWDVAGQKVRAYREVRGRS